MKYLAVMFAMDPLTNQTFSCSTEVDIENKVDVLHHMMNFSKTDKECVDTILLIENGPSCPRVVHFWTSMNF